MSETRLEHFYNRNYKKLLIIPIIIFIFAISVLVIKYTTTGEIIDRDVSLKGGISATIYTDKEINANELSSYLKEKIPTSDISVRALSTFGTGGISGVIIDASGITNKEITPLLEEKLNLKLDGDNYSIQEIGSSLGESFYKEMLIALLSAFIAMAWVVFAIYGKKLLDKIITCVLSLISIILVWKTAFNNITVTIIFLAIVIYLFLTYAIKSVPSIVIIFSAFLDIIVPFAIISLFNFKLSSAGIAAFLMVIGYSVDTDIVLTTRLLKRESGTFFERLTGAFKTGMTMTLTTIAALIVGILVTQSSIIKGMFTIILIALIVDIISTWIMNASLLTWYIKRKENEISKNP